MDNSHIGREHAHALAAIHERARQALAARRFVPRTIAAEPVAPPPLAPEPVPRAPAARPTPKPAVKPESEPVAIADPDEDLDFLDGRWTSRGW